MWHQQLANLGFWAWRNYKQWYVSHLDLGKYTKLEFCEEFVYKKIIVMFFQWKVKIVQYSSWN